MLIGIPRVGQVHFFSVLEVPPVLLLISGDTLFSEFEARACLVARFGEDIRPENCQQMAAAGMHLVRSVLNTEVSLLDPGSLDELARVVCDSLEAEELPLSEPLNSMILLGCLFGEMVRNQIGPVAAFKTATVVARLPKTRSGKILRGTMAKIADSEDYRMPATIDDPAILDEIGEALKEIGYAN